MVSFCGVWVDVNFVVQEMEWIITFVGHEWMFIVGGHEWMFSFLGQEWMISFVRQESVVLWGKNG